MNQSEHELDQIAKLAYLDMDAKARSELTDNLRAIMTFADHLRQIDTANIAPLSHPLHVHQPLRSDEVTAKNYVNQLEAIAPLFSDQLYLVPKVISTEK